MLTVTQGCIWIDFLRLDRVCSILQHRLGALHRFPKATPIDFNYSISILLCEVLNVKEPKSCDWSAAMSDRDVETFKLLLQHSIDERHKETFNGISESHSGFS